MKKDEVNTIKLLEKRLKECQKECDQLKNLIEALPGDIYWKDINGIWLGINNRGEQSLKRMGFIKNLEDVIGKTDYEIFNKDTADIYRKNDFEVLSKQIETTQEETVELANGDKLIQLSTKRPIKDNKNNIIGIVGNTIDITYLKKIEAELKKSTKAAEAANHAKSEFLANMRHDIRTPLSGIVGFSEILKSKSNEPEIKEYADNLITSSHALLQLMDEVLEAVKVSSGEIPRLKRKFNLLDTFEKVIALYSAKAREKKLNLSLSLDKNLPEYVIGDNIRVHRIALELVGNALNFTDIGHVSLKVTLAKKENRHLVIKITVSDSGMGIHKDKQQEIYLQFKRLTPSYQGIYKGAGLGLYVVKQFVDELEGEIYVESELNKGTNFTCIIPLQEPLLDDATGIEHLEDLRNESLHMTPIKYLTATSTTHPLLVNIKVLLVEDNRIAQTVTQTLLSSMNCQVDIAGTGLEAIKLYKNNIYDIVFMDIGLGGGLDGYEVTHKIRTLNNESPHVPIIALTAHAGDENKQRCVEAGMDAVITKPLTQHIASRLLNSFITWNKKLDTEVIESESDLPNTKKHLFQLDQYALLDTVQALKDCGSIEVYKELLKLMAQELPNDLVKMRKALRTNDYETLEKIAHQIKGGAVYIGANKMKFACQYVEQQWKSDELELVENLSQQAIDMIEKTLLYIKIWLKEN